MAVIKKAFFSVNIDVTSIMTNSVIRRNWIESMLQSNPGRIEYICPVDEEDVPLDRREFFMSKLKGDEILVEFHRFHLFLEDDVEIAMLQQFRVRSPQKEMKKEMKEKEKIKVEDWIPSAYLKSTDVSTKCQKKSKRKIMSKKKSRK